MDRKYFLLILLFFISSPVFAQPLEPTDTAPENRLQNDGELEEVTDEEFEDTVAESGDTILQFQVGLKAFQSGELREAVSRLQRSYRGDTTHDRARYWLGQAYYADGRNDSAIALWKNHNEQSELASRFQRELAMHQRRYSDRSVQVTTDWDFLGVIPGRGLGENRLTNPSAVESIPEGGWFVSSHQLGKVSHYSSEGRLLRSYENFDRPLDLKYVDGLGLLVVDQAGAEIDRIVDTGAITTWSEEGFDRAERLFSVDSRMYLFDSARETITQMSPDGDTVGVIWKAGTRQKPVDVALGPKNNFWILDPGAPEFLVIDRFGEEQKRIDLSSQPELHRLWWQNNHLFVASRKSLHLFDVETKIMESISVSDGKLEGRDVFDLNIQGNQVLVALFQQSALALYRMGEVSDPQLLIQPRQLDVRRFPIIRYGVLVEDGGQSGRFNHLHDQNLSVEIEGRKVLPGLLRQTESLYRPSWIMIVDNRIDDPQRWEEIRPSLIEFVEKSPEDALGSVWTSRESIVQQGFTRENVLLRNALTRISMDPDTDRNQGDTVLQNRLNIALDVAFDQRGPTGVILVSNHISHDQTSFLRIAQRFRNNQLPLIIVNPSVKRVAPEHPLRRLAPNRYHDFHRLDGLVKRWTFYERVFRSHYTIVYKSPLSVQRSDERRPYQLIFQFLNQTTRYSNDFLLP